MEGNIHTQVPTTPDQVAEVLYEFGDFRARYPGTEVGALVVSHPRVVFNAARFMVHGHLINQDPLFSTDGQVPCEVPDGRAIRQPHDNWTAAFVQQKSPSEYRVVTRDDLPDGKTLGDLEEAVNASLS